MNILVVEDSNILLSALRDGLTRIGYAVDGVADGREGLEYALSKAYDVVVLDLMLPGMDGLTVLRRLREAGKNTHVLILSAKDQVQDRITGLQIGADDYMVKPFSFEELCARITALIRRKYQAKNPALQLGKVSLNTAMREVQVSGRLVRLTPGEYAILEALALNRGRVLSVEQLVDVIHDSDANPGLNVVQVMVCNVRKKLALEGAGAVVHTRRGAGYYVE